MELMGALAAANGRSLPSLLGESGQFGLFILSLTFVMSVVSWAVIWDRTRLYLRLRAQGDALRRAMASKGIGPSMKEADRYLPSVEASLLLETRRFLAMRGAGDGPLVLQDAAEADLERTQLRGLLEGRAVNEIGEMERHLILLSTTAGAAPFLGLLGTVWGIMRSFLSMGLEGAASIEVVGPGVAEALITTIAGLAAAVPALMGYNMLLRSVQRKETQIDLFISRVLEYAVTPRAAERANPARPARSGATL